MRQLQPPEEALVSLSTTLLLGFTAGVTILIGLPVGRLRRPPPALRVVLSTTAVGVVLFWFWDVLSAAWEPIDTGLVAVHDSSGTLGTVFGYGALFTDGLAVGLLSLVGCYQYMSRITAGARSGPGTMCIAERPATRIGVARWSPAKQLPLLIAVGIGLHNATEGFGIIAAGLLIGLLAGDVSADGDPTRPSWRFLLAMAAIGSGPVTRAPP